LELNDPSPGRRFDLRQPTNPLRRKRTLIYINAPHLQITPPTRGARQRFDL